MTWNVSCSLTDFRAKRPALAGILLAFSSAVKTTMRIDLRLTIVGAMTICIAAWGKSIEAQTQAPPALSSNDKLIVEAFEKRAKEYAKLREQLEEKMPKLSDEAKPEEIQTHKKQFQDRVRAARAGAKHGDIFTREVAALIRAIIKDEFKGRERVELRDTVLRESDTKAVPLRVNYPYPESQELLEMAPTLLLRLPQLPKQLRYRFVGRNLLLIDRENGLIVDYMTNALP
jgi:hypothetical protein